MKISKILSTAKRQFPSLEFVPPIKGSDIKVLYEALAPYLDFGVPYINVTAHRGSKRPGTVALASAIMRRFPVEVVPHIICAGADKTQIENELIDLHFLDIHNVMALRGDPVAPETSFIPAPGGHSHSEELVRQIVDLNNGIYVDGDVEGGFPTDFCIGVAGYPEKHFEAPSLDSDIAFLKHKVDAGADYIITQMFFDNSRYYDFVAKCRAAGIDVPIIPGLKPIANLGHFSKLPATFSIELPEELKKEAAKCRTNSDAKELGKEWCLEQSRDLLAHGVPAIHYYTMSKTATIVEILGKIF